MSRLLVGTGGREGSGGRLWVCAAGKSIRSSGMRHIQLKLSRMDLNLKESLCCFADQEHAVFRTCDRTGVYSKVELFPHTLCCALCTRWLHLKKKKEKKKSWRQQQHVSVCLPGWCMWCRSQRSPWECVRPYAEQSINNKHTLHTAPVCACQGAPPDAQNSDSLLNYQNKKYILEIAFVFFPVLIIPGYSTRPKDWIQRFISMV